ncbi:hypothetical protein M3J09_012107 [Ascochyta lentis]
MSARKLNTILFVDFHATRKAAAGFCWNKSRVTKRGWMKSKHHRQEDVNLNYNAGSSLFMRGCKSS